MDHTEDFTVFMSIEFFRREPGETQLKYKSVKFQLKKLRDRQYPKKPVKGKHDTTFEVHKKYTALINEPNNLEEFGRTLDKTKQLYFGSVVKRDYTFHVFASERIIDIIRNHMSNAKKNYLIDGTFQIVPRLFYQLLIITVEFKNDVCINIFGIFALRFQTIYVDMWYINFFVASIFILLSSACKL